MVQWLGLSALTAMTQVQSLVRELRLQKPHRATKTKTSFLFPDAVLVCCMFLETSISSRLSNLLTDNWSWYPLMASYISMMSVVISPLSFLIFLIWVPSLLGEPSQRFSISFPLTLGLFVLLLRILLTGILDYLIFCLVF